MSKKNDKISILTYNISWESMSGNDNNWVLCSNSDDINNKKHFSKCVNNISKVINNNITDIITLQEASDYHKLLALCPNLCKMKNYKFKSGKEIIITFWNNKFIKSKIIKGEFEIGRPWLAIIFTNYLCIINVHFGHYNKKLIIHHINTLLRQIQLKCKYYDKLRIIISGDFNHNIKKISINNELHFNNKLFYINKKHLLTCCINRTQHYDHIIDTKNIPNIYIPFANYMASDHKPLLGLLQQ